MAGYDGGLAQHFVLEVVGGNPIYTDTTRSFPNTMDNEISTMNDQVYIWVKNIFWSIHIFFVTNVIGNFCTTEESKGGHSRVQAARP